MGVDSAAFKPRELSHDNDNGTVYRTHVANRGPSRHSDRPLGRVK